MSRCHWLAEREAEVLREWRADRLTFVAALRALHGLGLSVEYAVSLLIK